MSAPPAKSQPIPRLVQQLESADALHLAHQIEALNDIEPTVNGHISPLAGGLVLTSSPEFGHKLNRAAGLGIRTSLTSHEIDQVERLFAPTELAAKIDLCPYAGAQAFDLLRRRGYSEAGGIVVLAMDLSAKSISPAPSPDPEKRLPIAIRRVTPTDASDFLTTCIEGFLSNGRSRTLLSVLARIALARQDTTLYCALIDDAVAGAAGMSVLDTPQGKVAQLYIDSTLPSYRGRGVHGALIRERIKDAKLAGCEIVMLTAREGSGSTRNALREGFEAVYVKKAMIKGIKDHSP